MDSPFNWAEYLHAVQGRQPRPLFLDVLGRMAATAPRSDTWAIDLGCGDGVETRLLLAHGWRVLAIDQEPEALALLQLRIPSPQQALLHTQRAAFHEALLPPADLIYAGLSLPYCAPHHFLHAWRNVVLALKPGGRFAGHLFGERDDYARFPQVTGQTRRATETLLQELEIEHFEEREGDVVEMNGAARHWHVFSVIARKAV